MAVEEYEYVVEFSVRFISFIHAIYRCSWYNAEGNSCEVN